MISVVLGVIQKNRFSVPKLDGGYSGQVPSFAEVLFSIPSQTAHKIVGSVLRSTSFHLPDKIKSIFPFLQTSQIQIPWLAVFEVWYLYLFMIFCYISLLPVILCSDHPSPGKFLPWGWNDTVTLGNRTLRRKVYFFSFSRSRISVNSCSSLLGSGGAAGTSFSFLFSVLIPLIIIKIAAATIVKSKTV